MNKYISEDKQQQVLQELHELLVDYPMRVSHLAKEIGISRVWLDFFMSGNKIGYFSLCKVESYIKKQRAKNL